MINDVDLRLAALFAEADPAPNPRFAERVIALAAYDLKLRRARRAAVIQIGGEALALVAVLICFCLLTLQGAGQAAGSGDVVRFGSPPMMGLALLVLWGLVTSQNQAVA